MPNPNASFNIVAKDKTGKTFSKVNKNIRALRQSTAALSGVFGKLAAAAVAVAGPLALGALVKSSLSSVDALAKTADRLDATTEELIGFHQAAELTGVKLSTANMGLQRLTRRLGEAARGTGVAKDALIELGLDANALSLQSPIVAFQEIADAMSNVESQTQRVRLAQKLFDSEGVALLNTLQLGKKGLQDITAETERLGLAFSRVDAAQVEAANDAFTKLGSVIAGIGQKITIAMAPFATAISNSLTNASAGVIDWQNATIGAIELVAKAVVRLGDLFFGFKLLWKTLEIAFAGMVAAVSEGLRALSNDVLALLSALPVVGDKFQELRRDISEFAESAGLVVGDLVEELRVLAAEGLPSEGLDAFFENVRAQAAMTAAAVKDISGGGDGDEDEEGTAGGETEEEFEARRELLAERLGLIKEVEFDANLETTEQLADALAARDNLLANNLARRAKTLGAWEGFFARQKAAGIKSREKLEKLGWEGQIALVSGSLASITASAAESNKTMFNLNKVAGIANAIVSTAVGVTKALELGPILGPIMAAAQLAAGLIQINKIKSQSFGGGGSPANAPSPQSLPTGSPVSTPGDLPDSFGTPEEDPEPSKIINISISGNPTGEQVRELIQAINEEIGDGAELMAETA